MIPSLEIGALGGMLSGTYYNIMAFAWLETFLFGLKLGIKF